jgi:hypothetical protein
MSVLISFNPRRRNAAKDAAIRLRVLYPSINVSFHEGELELSNIQPENTVEVVQAAADQILRSQYSEDTSNLRDRLYARLLG